jgi:hypothetical protein
MTSYWLSYRIADDIQHHPTYEQRYKALTDALSKHIDGLCWSETTSFIVFESHDDINAIAQSLESAIDTRYDLFLIRELERQSAIICGFNSDGEIHKLMPYLKKL